MSSTYVNREDAGVEVRPSYLSEVHVHVTTSATHTLPFDKDMRLYFDIDSGDALDNLIEVLIEARGVVTIEANRRWNEEVKADADSELCGNPKEEAA